MTTSCWAALQAHSAVLLSLTVKPAVSPNRQSCEQQGSPFKAKLNITYVTCMQVSLVAGQAQSLLRPKGVTKAMFDLQVVCLIDNSWFLTTT